MKFIDDNNVVWNIYQNAEGFWMAYTGAEPASYINIFSATSVLDKRLVFSQNTPSSWFQIDEVYLAPRVPEDSYTLLVSEYDDSQVSENPQLYNEVLRFPNPLSELLVPINEYVTHTAFNSILQKFGENYQFLIDKSKYLSVPPTYVSFRYGPSTYKPYESLGNVWQQMDNGLAKYWGYDEPLSAENVAGTSTFLVYSTGGVSGISGEYFISGISATSGIVVYEDLSAMSGATLYEISGLSAIEWTNTPYTMSSSGEVVITGDKLVAISTTVGINPTQRDRDYYVYGDDKFYNIVSIEIDSRDYVWILDNRGINPGKIGIFEFDGNTWKFIASWSSDYPTSLKYFMHPTDLKIKGGRAYIACDRVGGGVECRVFDVGGSYIGSAYEESLSAIESMAITDHYLVILANNALYEFDISTFEFIERVDLEYLIYEYHPITQNYSKAPLTKLSNGNNGKFFYGISTNLIYKFGENGSLLESFGEINADQMNSVISGSEAYIEPITDLYHDSDYNLYASSNYDIIKYFDRESTNSLLTEDLKFNIDDCIRNFEENKVFKDENAAAWVYNRVFDRILDNLNLFRLALKGSLALIATSTSEKVVINNFKISNFAELPYSKGDIAIGVNEIHCEGALNRCIIQLNECFETCKGLLSIRDTGIDPDALQIQSFELMNNGVEVFNGVYCFEYNRPVGAFEFQWEDNVIFRDDPRLRAYITYYLRAGYPPYPETEVELPIYPTPTTYTDYKDLISGSHVWILRENFGSLSRTAQVEVSWNKPIYYGTYEDGTTITQADVLSGIGNGGMSINPYYDGEITINVEGKRFYIAMPKYEYENYGTTGPLGRNVVLYHPDYPSMAYDYTSLVTIQDFTTDYGNNGDYYVITPSNTMVKYSPGINEIKFRLSRGNLGGFR